ncbi:alpha-1,2-fucosyltransferase [Parapedobacter pyrenivorans]|uniref:Alpha-1,2-fucosyltransferase n=1 Tax=Parapedobacter pyrenivorans TaxID=1305674 RepID=A0A917HEW7_9SPHI|nr:alpha-1,2-fucosyltransferase [Parapedobacter pyrenivorans]GGG76610.1 alpha-1,2-fucosyltransferase [Parapedobacter pyrenivorans]
MKVVKFLGGLGNQLFQYAFFCALQQKFPKVRADLSEYDSYGRHNGFELERIFGVQLPQLTPFERRLFSWEDRRWLQRKLRRIYGTKRAYYEEKVLFGYDGPIFEDRKHRYYWGYWQHIRYIERVADRLRAELRFPDFSSLENIRLAEVLADKNTVSVHVRRGDYINDPLLGGICDVGYYQRALAYIGAHVDHPRFIFFSDDIPWCRKNFPNPYAVFVDWNTGKDSFRDMQLMSLCKHHIIANSSFSWWGAWLNTQPDKIVVSPSRWVTIDGLELSGIILPGFRVC